LKKLFVIFFFTLSSAAAFAQADSSYRQKTGNTILQKPESTVIRKSPGIVKRPVPGTLRKDSARTAGTVIRKKIIAKPGMTLTTRKDSFIQRPESTLLLRPRRMMVKPGMAIVRKDSARISDSLLRRSRVADSAYKRDSVAKILLLDSLKQDSLKQAAARALAEKIRRDTATYRSIMPIPYLPFNKPLLFMVIKEKVPQSKDELFYLLCGLVFLVAFIRLVFPKYFNNLFLLLFQPSFRQRQTREQLMQDNLASLLMTLVFVISGGIYFEFLLIRNGLTEFSFWWLLLYSTGILVTIYLGKYLFLLFAGWVFHEKEAARTYIFVVFLVNKIIGIILIPFLLQYLSVYWEYCFYTVTWLVWE
jgi:hypothetical protein